MCFFPSFVCCQIDVTSCQGVLFSLCMVMLLCAITISIVVPFGYVSSPPSAASSTIQSVHLPRRSQKYLISLLMSKTTVVGYVSGAAGCIWVSVKEKGLLSQIIYQRTILSFLN